MGRIITQVGVPEGRWVYGSMTRLQRQCRRQPSLRPLEVAAGLGLGHITAEPVVGSVSGTPVTGQSVGSSRPAWYGVVVEEKRAQAGAALAAGWAMGRQGWSGPASLQPWTPATSCRYCTWHAVLEALNVSR